MTIAAIPVVFVLIVLCRIAAQREIRWFVPNSSLIDLLIHIQDHVNVPRLDVSFLDLL